MGILVLQATEISRLMKIAMFLNRGSRIIGTFSSIEAAGQGLDRLVFAGFPLARVFLIGNDLTTWQANGKALQGIQLVDQAQAGAIRGTGWGLAKGLVAGNLAGGATGILLGLGILALPGVGHIALTSAIGFTMLSGGICTAAGGLIGGLIGLGLTENQVNDYNQQLSNGNYLLVVNGTRREIQVAERILGAQSLTAQQDYFDR